MEDAKKYYKKEKRRRNSGTAQCSLYESLDLYNTHLYLSCWLSKKLDIVH